MAQIALKKLTTEWVDFSTILQPEDDTLYYLQNRGNDYMIACEGDTTPTGLAGVYVQPKKMLKYKKGSQKLYLRSHSGTCVINISNED